MLAFSVEIYHLIFTLSLNRECYFNLHFTNEEVEVLSTVTQEYESKRQKLKN